MSPKIQLSEAVGSTVLRQSEACRKAAEARSEAVGTRSRFPPIPPRASYNAQARRQPQLFSKERRGA